jgi:hypothetical protein
LEKSEREIENNRIILNTELIIRKSS